MNVKELKEKIEKLPDNMEVCIDMHDMWSFEISEVHITTGYVKDRKVVKRPCKETAGAKKCLIIF